MRVHISDDFTCFYTLHITGMAGSGNFILHVFLHYIEGGLELREIMILHIFYITSMGGGQAECKFYIFSLHFTHMGGSVDFRHVI